MVTVTEDEIRTRAGEVFEVMEKRVSAEELSRIRAAFCLAYDAHKKQSRNTGEPYIVHPIAVARVAAVELEQDANVVIAAFLHDVVEDTPLTINDIHKEFGDDVACLVDAVTKKVKKTYESSKQIDNYRQMLDSVHYDIRALLLKLSDRLHNMRTLQSMRSDKQMKIAGETDFFYAPLAGRLGLYHVKSDLENLSFKFRCPKEYDLLHRLLEEDKQRTLSAVTQFTDNINAILSDSGLSVRTQVRYRKPYSVWRNMREQGCDFAHVDFKHYIRVIYTPQDGWSEKDASLFIYSRLSSKFRERPGSVTNYIDAPKDNGYQSFHVKFLNEMGSWEELHISSERMVRNARLGCVMEGGETWLDRFQTILKDIAEQNSGAEFMEGVRSSLYNEDIVAYTPQGIPITLPKGATALDFAFEAYASEGFHAQYARINGRLCSIKTELNRGDCVEIGMNAMVHPEEKWLTYAKTYRSHKYLKSYLDQQAKPQFIRCPECCPLPGDEVVGFAGADGSITLHSRFCPVAIRTASGSGDTIVDVNFTADETLYPVRIVITAVDRFHLLQDIIDCIVQKTHLSMNKLTTVTEDQIVTCTIDFAAHSGNELQRLMEHIAAIQGIEEVQRSQVTD